MSSSELLSLVRRLEAVTTRLEAVQGGQGAASGKWEFSEAESFVLDRPSKAEKSIPGREVSSLALTFISLQWN